MHFFLSTNCVINIFTSIMSYMSALLRHLQIHFIVGQCFFQNLFDRRKSGARAQACLCHFQRLHGKCKKYKVKIEIIVFYIITHTYVRTFNKLEFLIMASSYVSTLGVWLFCALSKEIALVF